MARLIGDAGSRFASHLWRNAASGNIGGWQVARALQFLTVLTGSVGTRGGTLPHGWTKFKPQLPSEPPLQKQWNELLYPREYPLSHYEMSILLPYFFEEGRGKLDVYFTRVYNPVWTNPDGQGWIKALREESKIGLQSPSLRPGARPPTTPITSFPWGSPESGTTFKARRPMPVSGSLFANPWSAPLWSA